MINSISPIRMYVKYDGCEPKVGTEGSAAIDLRVKIHGRNGYTMIDPGETVTFETGIHIEIPVGWCGIIIPRSGSGMKGLHIRNVVGLIDADYRGQIKVGLENDSSEPIQVADLDRVAQMVIIPHYPHVYEMVESITELSPTDRGEGGFGHSGKQ